MISVRTLLATLLGLVLLVQGFAVSATSWPAAGEQAVQRWAADAVPPCHGGAVQDDAQDESRAPSSCCDEGCPHMAQCLLGHLAGASLVMSLPAFAAAHAPAALRPQALPAPRIASLLRPPIPLHG